MNRTFWAILALLGSLVTANAATLLPNGKQTFIDQNGAPLSAGTIAMYIPGTTTAKNTWKDSAQTILNTNPIQLDASGQAIIYGSGCYRQIVKDHGGNTIWDQPTCDTSSTSLIWAGTSSGTANNQTLTASNFSSQDGQAIGFIAGLTNSSALTLTVNGSPINVLRDTASGPFSLGGGEVFSGNTVQVQYDATRGAFHLINNPVVASNPVSTISASGTTDLGVAASRLVTITGTANITSFGSSASQSLPSYTLKFTGASKLVNSGALQVPGGADITVSPGDFVQAIYLGSGNWQVYGLPTGVPGEVRSFATGTCPGGWLEGAGQTVSATTYPTLFAALGTTWGTSVGNVILPETRGLFARGWDHGAGTDSGRTFGTIQQDQLQDHTHTVPFINGPVNAGASATISAVLPGTQASSVPVTGNHGTETRPKNFTVIYCVKY